MKILVTQIGINCIVTQIGIEDSRVPVLDFSNLNNIALPPIEQFVSKIRLNAPNFLNDVQLSFVLLILVH